jgi:hypothetical protein
VFELPVIEIELPCERTQKGDPISSMDNIYFSILPEVDPEKKLNRILDQWFSCLSIYRMKTKSPCAENLSARAFCLGWNDFIAEP